MSKATMLVVSGALLKELRESHEQKREVDRLTVLACSQMLCDNSCEHGDMEDGHCLDCGADRTEELSAQAYDRAKDARKYGDT